MATSLFKSHAAHTESVSHWHTKQFPLLLGADLHHTAFQEITLNPIVKTPPGWLPPKVWSAAAPRFLPTQKSLSRPKRLPYLEPKLKTDFSFPGFWDAPATCL